VQLSFTKMQGLGNDFVVIDAVRQPVSLGAEQLRVLADRRFGVGCDQILFAEKPTQANADFRYRIFNADGGEVEQCGNGVRCLARFLTEQGLTAKRELVIQTLAGDTRVLLGDGDEIRVDMGPPQLEPAHIPFEAPQRQAVYELDLGGESVALGVVSMGNPHAVMVVNQLENAPVARLGPYIETHPRFPRRVNVGFMQILDAGHIRLRVFERGVGETLACGTGACAAVVAGRLQQRLDERVRVDLPGGTMHIEWAGEGEPVWMTGPAVTVFQGQIEL
jgi:diaminopimelate epimerase